MLFSLLLIRPFLVKSTSLPLGTAWGIKKISAHHSDFTSNSYPVYHLSALQGNKTHRVRSKYLTKAFRCGNWLRIFKVVVEINRACWTSGMLLFRFVKLCHLCHLLCLLPPLISSMVSVLLFCVPKKWQNWIMPSICCFVVFC